MRSNTPDNHPSEDVTVAQIEAADKSLEADITVAGETAAQQLERIVASKFCSTSSLVAKPSPRSLEELCA